MRIIITAEASQCQDSFRVFFPTKTGKRQIPKKLSNRVAASKMAHRRLFKEIAAMKKTKHANEIESELSEENIFCWVFTLRFNNPPYNQRGFRIQIDIPKNYPFSFPKVTFLTPIHHPNVSPEGLFCHDHLTLKGWGPKYTIQTVLDDIVKTMDEPNLDHPLRPDLADQYRKDKDTFLKDAEEQTLKHGLIINEDGTCSKPEEVEPAKTDDEPVKEDAKTDDGPVKEDAKTDDGPEKESQVDKTDDEPVKEDAKTDDEPVKEDAKTDDGPEKESQVDKTDDEPVKEDAKTDDEPVKEDAKTDDEPVKEDAKTDDGPDKEAPVAKTDEK